MREKLLSNNKKNTVYTTFLKGDNKNVHSWKMITNLEVALVFNNFKRVNNLITTV